MKAALASFLHARWQNGHWLVRIDDIDPPREIEGARESILSCLRAHALPYNGLQRQSAHADQYETALAELQRKGLLFRCRCTRSTLGARGCCVADCQDSDLSAVPNCSLRLRVPENCRIEFFDLFQGYQSFDVWSEAPNFILKRRDGLFAYQLATAIDDSDGVISHVIRGDDLLSSTPRQILLQQLLDRPTPAYGHFSVINGPDGVKLSKQTGAPELKVDRAISNLIDAACTLGVDLKHQHFDSTEAVIDYIVTYCEVMCDFA